MLPFGGNHPAVGTTGGLPSSQEDGPRASAGVVQETRRNSALKDADEKRGQVFSGYERPRGNPKNHGNVGVPMFPCFARAAQPQTGVSLGSPKKVGTRGSSSPEARLAAAKRAEKAP